MRLPARSSGHLLVKLCAGTAFLLVFMTFTLHTLRSPTSFALGAKGKRLNQSSHLGIASQIYVISLPRRSDRRQDMETLRAALSLQWTYVDAIDAQHPAIGKILDNVREQRSDTSVEFRWPSEIDTLASSSEPLDIDNWMSASTDGTSRVSSISGASSQDTSIDATPTPLVCATQDNSILPYAPTLSQYRILSPEKIACWYSHLAVIRQVAEHKNRDKNGATIILEDDIDMEWDIRERLGAVWNLLPAQWDIVFLGHCWSNESYHPALQPFTLSQTNESPSSAQTHLHPSYGPKCTHAYALSPAGARRILLHLLYPPFAYSRAVDQALMWLVRSGRLTSFSVVPSVVVQRKVAGSDIMSGQAAGNVRGSDWRDGLVNGVFKT